MPKVKSKKRPPKLNRMAAARVLRELGSVRPHAGLIVEPALINEEECDGINSHHLSQLGTNAHKVLEDTKVEGYLISEDQIVNGRMRWASFCRPCAMKLVTLILELECPT